MTDSAITDEGYDKISKLFTSMAASIGDELRPAMLEAGHVIQSAATDLCPIDIGHLRGSILTREGDSENDTLSVTVGVHPDTAVSNQVEYAPYIEYGTGIYAENGNGRKTPWSWQGLGGKYAGWHTTSGMHAQPFLRPAYDQNVDECIEIINEHIGKMLEGV